MNWKDIYTESTPAEREDILLALLERPQCRSKEVERRRSKMKERIKSFLSFFRRSRARAHWLGEGTRPVRPQRAYILLTFALAMLSLEPYEYAVWSVVVGGAISIMVTVESVYRTFARIRASSAR